jgi:hypothetical protein
MLPLKLDVQQTSQQPVVKQQNKSVNVSKDKVVATQTNVCCTSNLSLLVEAFASLNWKWKDKHIIIRKTTNISTKSDKLDVQQTSQQPVVKQQNKSVNVSKDKVVANLRRRLYLSLRCYNFIFRYIYWLILLFNDRLLRCCIVNKGVALKRYSLILVVFLIMMCLSFHFQFNEVVHLIYHF